MSDDVSGGSEAGERPSGSAVDVAPVVPAAARSSAKHRRTSPVPTRQRHRSREVAPNTTSRVLVIGLLVGAVLLAVGVAAIWGRGTPAGKPAAGSTPTASASTRTSNAVVTRRAAIADLFDRRGESITARDRGSFLADIDPSETTFRDEQSDLYDRLAKVPFASWSYSQEGDGPELTKDQQTTLPTGSVSVHVRLRFTFDGSTSPLERDQYFIAVPRAGRWLLAAQSVEPDVSGASPDVDIWDLEPVTVVKGQSSLVIGDAAAKELRELADEADRGVRDVGQVWHRDWSRRPIVIFPKSQADMARLIGSDGKGLDQIAAVTTGSFESGLSRGDRVVVNPGTWRTLGSAGRRVVLAHELTHLATRAITDRDVPIWLSEGFADYVAYTSVEVPTEVVAGDVLDDVRAGKSPTELPDDADFDAAHGDIAAAYESAWLACRMIAEKYGQRKLIALYVMFADSSSAAGTDQIQSTLGISEAQLTKQWRRYLVSRAG